MFFLLVLGIKETPQVAIPEGIINAAWQPVVGKLEDTTLAVIVDGIRIKDEEDPLSLFDQLPQEMEEEKRLANAWSSSDDCFADGALFAWWMVQKVWCWVLEVLSRGVDGCCNELIAFSNIETFQRSGGDVICKYKTSTLFSCVEHVAVEGNFTGWERELNSAAQLVSVCVVE